MKTIALVLALCMASCTSTWAADFKTNPVLQTENILGFASGIMQVAQVAFGQLKPMLPADKQAVYQAKFDEALVILVKAAQAIRSTVQAAATAGVEKPNLTQVLGALTTAILDIQKLVAEIGSQIPSPKSMAMAQRRTAVQELNNLVVAYQGSVDAVK